MIKTNILIIAFTLAGLVGMAQTNQPLPSGAVPFGATTYLSPLDSTIWLYKERDGTAVNLGSWHKVDSLLALKADASDLADFYTQSQIDAFLALKADVSSLAGYVPTSRTINGKALTGNITLQMADIPNLVSTLANKADLSDLDNVLRSGDNNSELNNDAGYVTAATAPVTSVNGKTGAVAIDKGDLGLGNIDNTSDANKPISTATQSALDGKEAVANKRTTLTSPNNTTYPTTQAVADAIAAVPTQNLTAGTGIDISDDEVNVVFGSSAGTVAQGNDSRINNGQTAFEWGDYRQFGLGVSLAVADADLLTGNQFFSTSSSHAFGFGSGVQFQRQEAQLRAGQIHIANGSAITEPIVKVRAGSTGGWGPIRTLWHDGNFNPSNYLTISQRGAPNGVASLDGSGKVPTAQLPTTGMQYQGTWNASTNIPTLSDGTGTEGYFYRVTTAGTQNLGSGSIAFSVGDDVIHNGSVWQRAPSGSTVSNLALGTRTSTTMPITNSNGTGVTLPARTASFAGLMTPTDLSTLNSALQTESDPTVPAYVKAITSGDISNWNTAFSRGDFRTYGLGINPFVEDADAIEESQFFSTSSAHAFGFGSGVHMGRSDGSNQRAGQIHIANGSSGTEPIVKVRALNGTGWTSIRTLWHDGNFNPSNYLTTANFTWTNLSGKPSTFTPSAHTHSGADIVSGTVPFARLPTGTSGSTVAIGNHTHTLAGDVTGGIGSTVIANSAVTFGKIQNIGTNTIVGRIAAGTGDATALTATQVRSIINVANGATANSSDATLLNRANHTGTQAIATVSGLQSTLDSKMSIDYNLSPSAIQFAGDFNSLAMGSYTAGISTLSSNRPHTNATGGFLSFGGYQFGEQTGRIVTGRSGADEMWYGNGLVTNPYYRVASREWVTSQGFLTGFTESDPTVPTYVKTITSTEKNNWNTAYGWGDFRDFGLGVKNNPMSDVDNLAGSQFFATSSATPFGFGSGIQIERNESNPRVAQLHFENGGSVTEPVIKARVKSDGGWGPIRTIWHDGNFTPSDYAQLGTGSTQVRNNSQLDARYLQSVSGGSGVNVSGSTISVDNTVLRTTGNQTVGGTKTFSSPVVAPQYQGTSTTASSSIPTNAQSLFTASVSSNTTYTLTNLTGSPRHIQIMVTNTGSSDVFITFNGAKLSVSQSNKVDQGHTAIFTFLVNNGSAYGTKTLFAND